jgi:2-methylcitrate dehydratase PrpD
MTEITRAERLAAWVAGFSLADDQAEAARSDSPDARATCDFILDLLGVAVAGSRREASARIAMEDARASACPGVATLLCPGGPRVTAEAAAFANGVAAHSIEMDDVHNASSLHPGTAVIPAALGVAEELQRSGIDAIEAIIAGYEIMIRVGVAANPTLLYRQGFHPTTVCGVFGAAAAAGKLMELDAAGLAHAFGIAWSMASGNMSWQAEGSMTKRLQAGHAARNGVQAARLAQRGATGPLHVLEEHGFFHGYGGSTELDALTAGLGGALKLHETGIKPYACCRYNQAPVDGLLALRREHGLNSDDVESIEIAIATTGHALVAIPPERKRKPTNSVEAQFSLPYSAAVALCAGEAGPDQYLDPWLTDAGVLELAGRVTVTSDAEVDAKFPAKWAAKIRVRTRDGRTLEYAADDCLGDPDKPLGAEALAEKFRTLTKGAIRDGSTGGLIAKIRGLACEPDAGAVVRAVAAAMI